MTYNPNKHHRRSIRLKGYDYSRPGTYFVTLCVHERKCLFGDIIDEKICLNEYGEIVQTEWLKSSEIRKEIELDVYQIMPNHFHGIVMIQNNDRGDRPITPTGTFKMRPKSLSSLMAGFKSSVTTKINKLRDTPGKYVWQRDYYERIIRNEKELGRIKKYIIENPKKWGSDINNPDN
ncbi:MAG: transposase [Bacteroidales bacterium]|nr:transposase [Bacteroidales bacterium]